MGPRLLLQHPDVGDQVDDPSMVVRVVGGHDDDLLVAAVRALEGLHNVGAVVCHWSLPDLLHAAAAPPRGELLPAPAVEEEHRDVEGPLPEAPLPAAGVLDLAPGVLLHAVHQKLGVLELLHRSKVHALVLQLAVQECRGFPVAARVLAVAVVVMPIGAVPEALPVDIPLKQSDPALLAEDSRARDGRHRRNARQESTRRSHGSGVLRPRATPGWALCTSDP
mmetsp:Transcript_55866/g.126035  ORF Transcript_55866/g.126035 Transcript_55866/m.126035 type:complete len:222 (+) Transcript_55866:357-1022(+)